ncbi:phosphoribosyltransferase [Microbispora sp. NPDC088329]|uniref:phosphoribosyltransferase n=1 Tax=Microbispora sp. NPDC088329 TaxID=3154869 RepID=UPI003418BE16
MGDARAVTDLVISLYRNVPAARPGVCRICHTGPNNKPNGEPYEICSSCDRTVNGFRRHVEPVVPISLAVEEGDDNGLFRLVARKEAVPASANRLKPATLMAATIARFYEAHETCLTGLAGGPFTTVTTIPSTRLDRPIAAFHIMPQVIGMVSALRPLYKPLLLPNDKYASVLARRKSHPHAFQMMGTRNGSQRLRGERILLVDDLFVSGAHAQSAASTLFEAGAEEVVALVIIRLIVPTVWHENRMDIWHEASAQPFTFDRCCLCAQKGR